MSGIYIKGLEMPGVFCGADIVLYEGINGSAVPRKYKISADRVVSVPPHGRLIDGDYLKQTHCAECTLYPDKCLEKTSDGCDGGSIMHLRMCPTIIPADKDGDVK